MKNYLNYIESNHQIMLGKPIVKGTRITVELVLRKLSEGYTNLELISQYPQLSTTIIAAVLEYAADTIANEEVINVAS